VAEVLVEFSEPISDSDGITYVARACGAAADNGHWHGWVEFVPVNGGETLKTGRETTQPNRIDTVYWATGLSPVYLEGALHRALTPLVPRVPKVAAVFNPFSAYRHGEEWLRRQLWAFSDRHLVNILVAHKLSSQTLEELQRLNTIQLIELIVSGVRNAVQTGRTASAADAPRRPLSDTSPARPRIR
jgi:hypothetical protein